MVVSLDPMTETTWWLYGRRNYSRPQFSTEFGKMSLSYVSSTVWSRLSLNIGLRLPPGYLQTP